TSPRQIAEKARLAPRDAAAAFENGAVARWYRDNGWAYPVQGPAASGLGAVQQFFEALGVAQPPRVEISERNIACKGNAGDRLEHVLKVETEEKKPVFAHAAADQPWLKVEGVRLDGRTATITVAVPSVPSQPGEKLNGRVTVTANGNQRFWVAVSLQVGGRPAPRPTPAPAPAPAPRAVPVAAVAVEAVPALELAAAPPP